MNSILLQYSNMRVERYSITVIKVTDSLFHVPHTYALMWEGWTSWTGNPQNPKHFDFILWRHTCIVQNPQHKIPWNTGQWWPGYLPLVGSGIKMQHHKKGSTDKQHHAFCISFKKIPQSVQLWMEAIQSKCFQKMYKTAWPFRCEPSSDCSYIHW